MAGFCSKQAQTKSSSKKFVDDNPAETGDVPEFASLPALLSRPEWEPEFLDAGYHSRLILAYVAYWRDYFPVILFLWILQG